MACRDMPCNHKAAYALSTQKLLLFAKSTQEIDKQYMMQLIMANVCTHLQLAVALTMAMECILLAWENSRAL